jgi:hypothetical protein
MATRKNSRFNCSDERLRCMREADYENGVVVDPLPVTAEEEVTFLYYGLLDKSGADQVYLHCGYGNPQNWQNVQDVRMERTRRGWAKTIKVEDMDRFNFCFKDSANNWDNNNGINWSFEIHNG